MREGGIGGLDGGGRGACGGGFGRDGAGEGRCGVGRCGCGGGGCRGCGRGFGEGGLGAEGGEEIEEEGAVGGHCEGWRWWLIEVCRDSIRSFGACFDGVSLIAHCISKGGFNAQKLFSTEAFDDLRRIFRAAWCLSSQSNFKRAVTSMVLRVRMLEGMDNSVFLVAFCCGAFFLFV